MQVEFALMELMDRFDIPRRGAISALGERFDLGRQAASRIVRGTNPTIAYAHLGKICDWLIAMASPDAKKQELRRILPGALFRVVGPWDRLLRSESVRLFLGERWRDRHGASQTVRWISGADSEVATEIVHRASQDGGKFVLRWQHVPVHVPARRSDAGGNGRVEHNLQHADQERAMALFERARRLTHCVKLIIGSQRVNLLVDPVLADAFGCPAFKRTISEDAVPLYMQYRGTDPDMPESCFGGQEPPPGWTGEDSPGIYFRQNKAWQHLPCSEQEDAGVVVLLEDYDREVLEVVLFGFSGFATHALGRVFCEQPERFWPLEATKSRSRRVGAFVCGFECRPAGEEGSETSAELVLKDTGVIAVPFAEGPANGKAAR